MDDSFNIFRSKKKPVIISSDEEDEDDLLESSQLDENLLKTGHPQDDNSLNVSYYKGSHSGSIVSEEGIEDSITSSPPHNDLSRDVIEESEDSASYESSSSMVLEKESHKYVYSSKESDFFEGELFDEFKSSNNSSAQPAKDSNVVSSFKKDSVDFAVSHIPDHKMGNSVQQSPKWNWNKSRSVEDVQADLASVLAELDNNMELLTSVNSSILPDERKRLNDTILSLECIKQELESELDSMVHKAKFNKSTSGAEINSSSPRRSDVSTSGARMKSPTTRRSDESTSGARMKSPTSRQSDVEFHTPPEKNSSVLLDASDDDCIMVDEKYSPLNKNVNASSDGISIPNIRSVLKEKVSQNSSDIVNSPPHGDSTAVQWSNLPTTESNVNGLGKIAMKTYSTQQSLTIETLHTLHSALRACPSEDTLEDDPRGLRVKLMPHQKHALAWLLWRERERPSGGILADDMGLGKTLTMISLVLKSQQIKDQENVEESSDEENEETVWHEAKEEKRSKKPRGGTLVVCPASVVGQWEKEVERRVGSGLLSVLLYHGTKRETRIKRIARKDIVITTYNLMSRESGVETAKNCTELKSPGPLHCIKWERIILDEAHIVRNHKSQTAMGVFELSGKHRWCLTGTPIQNKELDLFSLLKFLRCSPFDDLVVWKRWVDNKNAAGMQRLATMMKSLMLRRTKEQLQLKGALQDLPKKEYEIISVKLDPGELKIYKKVALFSSTLFMQFLGQRAEKDMLNEARWGQSNLPTWEQEERPDNQFFTNKKVVEMYRRMKTKNMEIKSHQILVLLLRLRQICCHPGLVKEMLEKEDLSAAGMGDVETDELDEDLFSAMEKLAIDPEEVAEDPESESSPTSENSAVDDLSPENPILEFSRPSSKIRAVLDVISEKVIGTDDKAVIVSQWTSVLNIVHDHLRDMGVACEMLSGSVPVPKRMQMVDDFNSATKRNNFKVLLLSLTAGGVGLNLIGGNHLFLIDVHWNPQLEAQACDRVYRVGQTKPVHIYKFICSDTIEERIKRLQDNKLALAENVLTGTNNTQASKLTLQDLKMLFGIGLPQAEF